MEFKGSRFPKGWCLQYGQSYRDLEVREEESRAPASLGDAVRVLLTKALATRTRRQEPPRSSMGPSPALPRHGDEGGVHGVLVAPQPG